MITFKQYLSEKAMNRGEFSKTETRQGGNTKIGFEFECIVSPKSKLFIDLSDDDNDDDDKKLDRLMSVFVNARDDLSKELGVTVKLDDEEDAEPAEHYAAGHWLIVQDGSIKANSGVGIEINSPPEPLSKALKSLQKMFSWMSSRSIITNESTGLHINISLPGIENVDLVKLVLFLGEKHVLQSFGRLSNTYTKPQIQSIINNITGTGKLPKEASEMIRLAKSSLSSAKYSSIHIEKLKSGYLEFRVVGGADYHLDLDKIKDTVLRFVLALEIAMDPASERNEYLKKLTKILGTIEEHDENKDHDSKSLSQLLMFGDADDIKESLEKFLSNAKAGKIKTTEAKRKVSDWVTNKYIPSLFNILIELGIKNPSSKQRAEFKVQMKILGFDVNSLNSMDSRPIAGIIKAFNLK